MRNRLRNGLGFVVEIECKQLFLYVQLKVLSSKAIGLMHAFDIGNCWKPFGTHASPAKLRFAETSKTVVGQAAAGRERPVEL